MASKVTLRNLKENIKIVSEKLLKNLQEMLVSEKFLEKLGKVFK